MNQLPKGREKNMRHRRERILAHARRIIGKAGFEGLNLRDLASAADVTVPTIYNLIGNKDRILVELNAEMMLRIEEIFADRAWTSPLEMAEAMVSESTALLASDADFYRAAIVASAYMDQRGRRGESIGIKRRSERLPTRACRDAQALGWLRGKIPAEILGEQIFSIYRSACRDWGYRKITIEQFRVNALLGVYLCLAADAAEAFHGELVTLIQQLTVTKSEPSAVEVSSLASR